jgi:hypothetical protein
VTVLRISNVPVVVDDLRASTLDGSSMARRTVEGAWIDRIVGFNGSRYDVAMMRTPDGHGRMDLEKHHGPRVVSGLSSRAADLDGHPAAADGRSVSGSPAPARRSSTGCSRAAEGDGRD